MGRRSSLLALSILLSGPALALPAPPPGERTGMGSNAGTALLERSWQRLDAELRALDQMLPAEPEPPVSDVLGTPTLPPNLLRANEPASGPIRPQQTLKRHRQPCSIAGIGGLQIGLDAVMAQGLQCRPLLLRPAADQTEAVIGGGEGPGDPLSHSGAIANDQAASGGHRDRAGCADMVTPTTAGSHSRRFSLNA